MKRDLHLHRTQKLSQNEWKTWMYNLTSENDSSNIASVHFFTFLQIHGIILNYTADV